MSDGWALPAGFDRRTTPARPDLTADALRGRVSSARYTLGRHMRVAVEAQALRASPSLDAALDTQALFGEDVTVFDESHGWAWVQLQADHYVGYLPTVSLIAPVEATHRVSAPRTLVYPSADIKRPIVMALPMQARLAVTRTTEKFVEVAGLGCIWRDHVTPLAETEQDFIAVARRFLFAPYLWGGKTSSGIDCSGLVQIALHACGLPCPRDSDMIAQQTGTAVTVQADGADCQRGDLVCWKGHVGIVSDAGALLHANGHHMQVIEEPLAGAVTRIRNSGGGEITAVRRLAPQA
ncbi:MULTISPECIES: NlpC/P60 family protein [unclassified Beijerinckia]|uniref:C40 family peptidase n=1 Tax=unclassified Beijerinckia TaxID=2638183 RepID=UPI00089AAA13|nr:MULTISPECIES: NlpC/P60 family protein [unclassified Beijerinckia]MDH7796833.1 cell wall-associated NlpC family hydrolase [Beijerinckia sp. GAS462]SEC61687.1 NlpC/P60 family protein [Beijerinckia sp. 28-YEA-48]